MRTQSFDERRHPHRRRLGKVVAMFYLAGSLLFAVALTSALVVILASLAQYRGQMVAALRTLGLDDFHAAHGRTRAGAIAQDAFGMSCWAGRAASPVRLSTRR